MLPCGISSGSFYHCPEFFLPMSSVGLIISVRLSGLLYGCMYLVFEPLTYFGRVLLLVV